MNAGSHKIVFVYALGSDAKPPFPQFCNPLAVMSFNHSVDLLTMLGNLFANSRLKTMARS